MQPIDEDKFLCYSCNNWLINWHSLQNKNDQTDQSKLPSKSKAGQSSSSSSIPEEHHQQQDIMVVLNDYQQNNVQNVREKLQKYFYKPNFKQQENRDIFKVTITFKCRLCQKTFVKCFGAIRQRNNTALRFCKSCKRELEKYFDDSKYKSHNNTKRMEMNKESSHTIKKLLVNPLLVHKLKQLGTTIMPEDIAKNIEFKQLPYKPIPINENVVKINNERIDDNSSEILISFQQTVTEVFPLNITKNEHLNHENKTWKNINEIFKQIPKSISISVA